MSVLARYIARSVLTYTALVMTVLTILVGLYLFVAQQDEVGVGRYTVMSAFIDTLCNLPNQIFTLLPIGSLIGALLALGSFARSSELIVMRTAGVSVFRLAGWVMVAGAVLTVVGWGIGEYVSPPLQQYAEQRKMLAKFNQLTSADSQDLWAKDGNRMVGVQSQSDAKSFGGVYILNFNDEQRLISVGHAASARVEQAGVWRLKNYVETRFEGNRAITSTQSQLDMETSLSPEFLGLVQRDPDAMTVRMLWRYIQHLRDNNFDTREYDTAFWSRIARAASMLVIVVLAVPFAFGPMRSTGTGVRTVIGILLGASFYLLARVLRNGGEIFDLSPFIMAWGPTALLAVVTAIAISRVR